MQMLSNNFFHALLDVDEKKRGRTAKKKKTLWEIVKIPERP